MRHGQLLLAAILWAISVPARGQHTVFIENCDHDWSIQHGANRYGLVQESDIFPDEPSSSHSWTTIYFGSRYRVVHHTIWPVAGAVVIPLVCLCWFLLYGLGSIFKPDKKPPSPNPSPPP